MKHWEAQSKLGTCPECEVQMGAVISSLSRVGITSGQTDRQTKANSVVQLMRKYAKKEGNV